MKKTILLILAMPTALFAQEKFIIKGSVRESNPSAKVFLFYNAGNQSITDSTTLKNGTFEFTGQINEVTLASLVIDHNGVGVQNLDRNTADMAKLYLEKGSVNIFAGDSLSNARLSGTKANDDFMHYITASKSYHEAARSLNAEYYAAPDEKKNSAEFQGYIQKKQIALQQQINAFNAKFITENPDAVISLRILIDGINAETYPDPVLWQSNFLKLSKNLRESKSGAAFQKALDQLKVVSVGAMAPDFTQSDANNTPVKLSSFKGKYVLLDFWASWCGPCRNENPHVVKVFNHFKDKNFTILGVSLDNEAKKEDWLKAIQTDGLVWPQVSDLKGANNDAALLYQVKAIPQNILIDPSGKIIAKNIFGDALDNKLTEILGK